MALPLTLVVCLSLTGQVSAQVADPIQNWLAADCEVGQEGFVRAGLVQLGAQALPALLIAAQNGPDANSLAITQVSLSDAYDLIQSGLSSSDPTGLRPSDVAALQAQNRQDFIAQGLNTFKLNYRIRAIQGLRVIGGSSAIQALQQFANDTSSLALQSAAKDALAGMFASFTVELEKAEGTRPSLEMSGKFSLPRLRKWRPWCRTFRKLILSGPTHKPKRRSSPRMAVTRFHSS